MSADSPSRSEHRLRALLGATHAVAWVVDVEGNLREDSPSLAALSGQAPEAMRGLGWLEAVHPEDRARVPPAQLGPAAREGAEPVSFRIRRPDSTWREVSARALPVPDEAGRAVEWLYVGSDETDRLAAQRAASARDAAGFRALFDTDVVGAVLWTRDGRVTDANDAFLRLIGYDREDLAAGRIHWHDLTPPEQRAAMEERGRIIQERGSHPPFEKEYVRKDGTRVPVLVTAAYFPGSRDEGISWSVDLTPVKEAEAALRRSEERCRSFVEASTVAMWVTNAEGEVVEDSPSWRALSGQSFEQWKGHGWLDALHPDDRARAEQAWREAIRAQRPYQAEYRVRRADGSYALTLARGVPLRTPDGRVREWVGANMDITALRQAREESARLLDALASKERTLSAIIEQMPSGVLLAGPNGELTYANPQAEAIWGHAFVPSPDIPSYRAYRLHRLDGRECPPEELPLARSVLRGEVVRGEVLRLQRSEEDTVFVQVNCAPVRDEAGRTIAAVAVFDNITQARRTAERAAQLQAITSALAQALTPEDVARAVVLEALAGMGADAGIVYRHREDGAFVGLYDVGHFEPYIQPLRFLPPDHASPLLTSLRAGRPEYFASNEELAARFPARAAQRPPEYNQGLALLPMQVGGRVTGGLVLTYHSPHAFRAEERQFLETLAQRCGEALERAHLYEVTQAERRRAEEASRVKDEFLAILSHELRTPLTAILGWARMLRTPGLLPEKRERAVETIERNARSQTQLIEDLLDVSKIASGKLRLDVRPTPPVQVIEAALDVVRPAAEARGVRLSASLDPVTGPVLGDPDRLQQVVWNLLSNAVKFTPRGGSVDLRLAREAAQVVIEVRDTGEGIPREFLPHIFERFRQADASTTRRHGGLGLGLAIVRHLVELHGGGVEVRSEGLGRGATFTVRLPISAPQADPVAEARAPLSGRPLELATPPPELRGKRVLVVDDEPDTRELLLTLLDEAGARGSAVVNAAEALAALDREVPDLLVSDIAMPGMDGYALMRELRQRPAGRGGRVPAIALTAYGRMEDRAAALLAGFQMHVAKPIEPSELLLVAASVLRRLG